MISSLAISANSKWWTMFHLAFGVIATLGNIPVIVWFYVVLISTFYLLSFSSLNRPLILAATMAYMGGFELMARMTGSSPVIPWEAGKYLFMLLCLIGYMLYHGRGYGKIYGWSIILLAIPAVFIDESGLTDYKEIIFNVFGVFNIGMGILFFGTLRIRQSDLIDMLRLVAFPCLCALAYTVVKTPDFREIEFTLTAKLSTSGEFGSNQVSTVLGLGFMIYAMAYTMNWKFSGSRFADGFLALAFLVQGLLTFSRGGMIAAGIATLVFVFFILRSKLEHAHVVADVKRMALPLLGFIIAAVLYVNEKTQGNLFLRYQGETYGTLLGTREKDLATWTSNRTLVFFDDLELWKEYPVLGAGVGSSKHLRDDGAGIAAHVELSRLLAEHGIPGLAIFVLILMFGWSCRKEPDPLSKPIKMALFALAILTTFHSATRTFITPLLISMCALQIKPRNQTHDPLPGK
jgi:hypothetical protein